ncbi:hypothetical protein CYMTET_47360 [Cymbomonas tetramitiformis]|uniref:Uncharacterized protein n=1 Tax=Cymbomonas tetramitiformis TaxID=36881 RepID=A0AAE0BVH8_9CHLO|nr:hypothetical protein CYMTET_47360 [Cymbomonas tetramitiformis]
MEEPKAENEAQRDTTLSESFTKVLAIESEVYKSLNDGSREIGRERVESFLYLHFVSQLKEKLGEEYATAGIFGNIKQIKTLGIDTLQVSKYLPKLCKITDDAEGNEHIFVTGEECVVAAAKLIGAIKSGITEDVIELEAHLREEAETAASAQAENLRDLDLDGQEGVEDEEEDERVELGASEGGDDWEDAAYRVLCQRRIDDLHAQPAYADAFATFQDGDDLTQPQLKLMRQMERATARLAELKGLSQVAPGDRKRPWEAAVNLSQLPGSDRLELTTCYSMKLTLG